MAVIQGDEGIDFLIGTPRDDQITGAGSGDFIFGGGGEDFISGGAGNDIMRGGNGADTFYFGANSGHDLIVDFEPLEGDLIGFLRGAGLDKIVYNPFPDATTIYWAGDNTVTFLHTKKAEVEASFFFPE